MMKREYRTYYCENGDSVLTRNVGFCIHCASAAGRAFEATRKTASRILHVWRHAGLKVSRGK